MEKGKSKDFLLYLDILNFLGLPLNLQDLFTDVESQIGIGNHAEIVLKYFFGKWLTNILELSHSAKHLEDFLTINAKSNNSYLKPGNLWQTVEFISNSEQTLFL